MVGSTAASLWSRPTNLRKQTNWVLPVPCAPPACSNILGRFFTFWSSSFAVWSGFGSSCSAFLFSQNGKLTGLLGRRWHEILLTFGGLHVTISVAGNSNHPETWRFEYFFHTKCTDRTWRYCFNYVWMSDCTNIIHLPYRCVLSHQ